MYGYFKQKVFRSGRSIIHCLKELVLTSYDFVFPPLCFVCEKYNHNSLLLCDQCYKQLIFTSKITVHKEKSDFYHLPDMLYFHKIVTIWPYLKIIESLVHQIKYNYRKKLGIFLGEIAGRLLYNKLSLTGREMILPVPLHPVRLRERGYNQSGLLAEGLSKKVNLPIKNNLLIRIKNTKSQTSMTAEQRCSNLYNAFKVVNRNAVLDKTIYLIDDVATTGATINSCSYMLKQAGAEKIIGLAMARPVMVSDQ